MTRIFTPHVFKNYCYVVKYRDGNEYNVGVFMSFDGLKNILRKKWSGNLTKT